MERPTEEIAEVVKLVAAAATPDLQKAAILRWAAKFTNWLCVLISLGILPQMLRSTILSSRSTQVIIQGQHSWKSTSELNPNNLWIEG